MTGVSSAPIARPSGAVLAAAGVVLPPPSARRSRALPTPTPQTIVHYGFETPTDTFQIVEPFASNVNGDAGTIAYWGRTSQASNSGSYGLWCAASNGTTTTYWPDYPEGTRGRARSLLPELADYYSAVASMAYTMPSIGGADDYFRVNWRTYDASGTTIKYNYADVFEQPSWQSMSVDLSFGSQRLSRVAAEVYLTFNDNSASVPETGTGPTVDDFTVLGYKYGPVRSLSVTAPVEGRVDLSWPAPYRAISSSVEETRPITYRVWRAEVGTGLWLELTAGARSASSAFNDLTTLPGRQYSYVVQAWDTGAGEGRGAQSSEAVWPPKASLLTTPSGPSGVTVFSSFVSTGTLQPAHGPGSVVEIQCSRDGSTIATTVAGTIGADGATYSASLSLDLPGTWFIRARHADFSHAETYSGWRLVEATQLPVGLLTTPTAPPAPHTTTTFDSSGTLLPVHDPGALVDIQLSRDALSVIATVAATVQADGETYLGHVQLGQAGTWYIRARHADALHAQSFSGWRQVAVGLPPADLLTTPGGPASIYTTLSFVSTGTLMPAHSTAATVGIECSQDKSTIATTIPAFVQADGTTYSGTIRLQQAGTWFVRARHADASHSLSFSEWRQITATTPPLADLLTAPTSPLGVYTTRSFVTTGTLLPSHEPSAVVEIQCSRDGSDVTTTVVAAIGADGTTYSGSVLLPLSGRWYVRARHADALHSETLSVWSEIDVIQSPPADLLTTPTVPAAVVYASSRFETSGSLLPSHAPGAVVEIQCSRDQSEVVRSFGATIQADTTTYAGSVVLDAGGIWYVRARHADAEHSETLSGWRVLTVELPAAQQLTVPSAPASITVGSSLISTGSLLPTHSPGAVVEIQCSRDKSDIATSAVAMVQADSMTYSGQLSFPATGTWYIRARHADASHAETFSEWRAVAVVLPLATLSVRPAAPLRAVAGESFTTTGILQPKHAPGTVVEIQCSRDQSAIATSIDAIVQPDETTYSASITLETTGTWYLGPAMKTPATPRRSPGGVRSWSHHAGHPCPPRRSPRSPSTAGGRSRSPVRFPCTPRRPPSRSSAAGTPRAS